MSAAIKRARRLVLFNHKGGVGKTTLTVNIASALAESGKRVLLVDTDPQCSLSSFFLSENYLDDLLDKSESNEGNTLWTAVRPVSEGTGSIAPITPIKVGTNLYLAAGDIRLADFENSLADCWNLCVSRNKRGYICTSALSEVVDQLVAASEAQFVFFDAGPNIGPLNRVVLLDCTHFVVPAACDLFSLRALKTLGFALSDWVSTWQRLLEIAPEGSHVLQGKPRLLGFIPQGFRVYRGAMAMAPFSVLSELDRRVIEFVWKPLQRAYATRGAKRPTGLKLGQVKYFGTLVSEAQVQGKALWDVSAGNSENKEEARRLFAELAAKIESQSKE